MQEDKLTSAPCFLHAQPSALPLGDCSCSTCITTAPALPACGHTVAGRPGGPFPSSAGPLPSRRHARSPEPSCRRGDFLRHSVQGLRAVCQCCCERELGIHCPTSHTDMPHVCRVCVHCVCFCHHLLSPQGNAVTKPHGNKGDAVIPPDTGGRTLSKVTAPG